MLISNDKQLASMVSSLYLAEFSHMLMAETMLEPWSVVEVINWISIFSGVALLQKVVRLIKHVNQELD